MKVNMDDLLLAGRLDNDDELILLSQVCSGSDVPSFEKGFDLEPTRKSNPKQVLGFIKMTFVICVLNWVYLGNLELEMKRAKRFDNASSNFVSACTYLTCRWKHIKKTYKSQIYFIHSLTDSQRVASILNL